MLARKRLGERTVMKETKMGRVGDPGIIRTIGDLPPGALIRKDELARMFNRDPVSIDRAVGRGELPPPTRLLGRPVWMAGSIVRHLQSRLEAAARERREQEEKLVQMQPSTGRKE